MTTADTISKLREPFPVEVVKTRPGGGGKMLDYVPIEAVLERLLDVAPGYTWEGRVVSVEDGAVVVEGHLQIGDKRAFGVGAMQHPDLDMAAKSANSEAIKNAAKNGFGVALELWDAKHRELLEKQRRLGKASHAALKQEVWRIARDRLDTRAPTAKQIADLFGVTAADLASENTLREILRNEGVL